MPQCFADPAECLALGLAVLMVDLQDDGQPRVAKDDLSVASRDAEVLEQGRGRVPQVMDLDPPELVAAADSVERADQVARLDRTAGLGGEDGMAWSGLASSGAGTSRIVLKARRSSSSAVNSI